MVICIKNMVCGRCIQFVSEIFREAGFSNAKVKLGEVSVEEDISPSQMSIILYRLHQLGFEVRFDAKCQLIQRIKKLTFYFVYHKPKDMDVKFSDFLSSKLDEDYNTITTLFSSLEGMTIEKYRISLKIERVKEMMSTTKKTMGQIAKELEYSSLPHLSRQFKKVTGMTPSEFQRLQQESPKSMKRKRIS